MISRKDSLASEAEPWLVFCYGDDIAGQTFYNASQDSYYITSISDMLQKGICTSSHGWVVILDTEQGQCFLLNPFTSEKIHLPPQEWKSFKYNECLLSSSPHDPNCIVMFTYCDETRLLLCRPGDDTWSSFNLSEIENFYSPVICNGTIYGLNKSDRLVRFGMEHAGPIDSIRVKYLGSVPHLGSDSMGANLVGFYDWNLVGSGNELFLVQKYYMTRRKGTMVWSFQIFKMDFSKMKWEIVRNLGNNAFFIDPNTKGVSYSTMTGWSSSSSRILRNSIYFTQKEDRYLYRFDMKEKSISGTLPCPHLDDKMANSVWLMPDAVQSLKMWQVMNMHIQGLDKALHEKEKDVLEDSNKGDHFPISSKVVTKYSYLACIVGALLPLVFVLPVKKNKMKLGLVIAAASIGALLVIAHVIS